MKNNLLQERVAENILKRVKTIPTLDAYLFLQVRKFYKCYLTALNIWYNQAY